MEAKEEDAPACHTPVKRRQSNDTDATNDQSVMSPATKLQFNREKNLKRNEQRLFELGLTYKIDPKKVGHKRSKIENEDETIKETANLKANRVQKHSNRKAYFSALKTLEEIEQKWPYRSSQIQMLGRILEPIARCCQRKHDELINSVDRKSKKFKSPFSSFSNSGILSSRPIIVSGPSGTGKVCSLPIS